MSNLAMSFNRRRPPTLRSVSTISSYDLEENRSRRNSTTFNSIGNNSFGQSRMNFNQCEGIEIGKRTTNLFYIKQVKYKISTSLPKIIVKS